MEPVSTLTATAIATLAFQEFVKSGTGELAKKFTAAAIAKMDELRKLIWDRLRGRNLGIKRRSRRWGRCWVWKCLILVSPQKFKRSRKRFMQVG
jgi:hypothetical protein